MPPTAGNPFLDASHMTGWPGASPPLSPCSPPFSPASSPPYASLHASSPASPAPGGQLVLYGPTSLYGLYYNEHVHGPFASGLQRNPFTPGLSALSEVPKPCYATSDPLRERYPASRSPDDPLNWISEDLFRISEEKTLVAQQRQPLRCQSMPPTAWQ
ncbi:hypothetical protein Agub_g14165 [Astrephomene gubernaculifera]|uniref:Uncharacterized protein n=1 Tax=Astrephomene gubernaculifera TaxID=47775 RepID=A0AAD3E158_9CHLO|nr:hypothetical protein Agub_g14165 [Astrephomene gubernaculifera]